MFHAPIQYSGGFQGRKDRWVIRVRGIQNQGRRPPHGQRRWYDDCNACILRIIEDHSNRQIMDYLPHIARKRSL